MKKLELLKLKAEVANCRRVADVHSDTGIKRALIARADELEKQIKESESEKN